MRLPISVAIALGLTALLSLSATAQEPASNVDDASREAYSRPLPGLSEQDRELFFHGRSLFRQSWVVAPSAESAVDGLGPLYNRLACASCHQKNSRGTAPEQPGERMQSMLVRLSIPGRNAHGGPKPHPVYGDQLNEEGIPGVTGEGRAVLHWRYRTVRLKDGERVQLRYPKLEFRELAYGSLAGAQTSVRISPAVFGLGLLESVSAETLQSLAGESKADGVKGRVNRVWDAAQKATTAGRFGLKANAPNLRQQSAGAFIGDLGITSPLFPDENCGKGQSACHSAPSGGHPELSAEQLDAVEFYLAHLAVPARRDRDVPQVQRGEALFALIGCALCHRPSLATSDHPKFPLLSRRTIAPYTDLLIHDMGSRLADHRPDYQAGGRDWRTPPLWGIGLVPRINEQPRYLHDGRARTVQEAILWHNGEGSMARRRYAALSREERQALLAFIASL
ncbi:di-heme oxidoredictase family protein [Denitratisoma sp. agr-D3]